MLGKEYKEYCEKFSAVWKYIKSNSKDLDTIVSEICSLRNYFNEEARWGNVFRETDIAFVSSETCDYSKLNGDGFKDLALFSKEGNFLLNERYIIPVRDMLGNIIALIGWYPDSKRYITTPSKFFSKDCLFFGLEQLKKTGIGKDYFVVEGIFDALSIRSIGYNAVAQMGLSDSKVKMVLYGLFRRIVAIPDNDKGGRKVVIENKWNIPQNGSYLRWRGNVNIDGTEFPIKDIDNLINIFGEEDVKELLNSSLKDKNRIISIDLM